MNVTHLVKGRRLFETMGILLVLCTAVLLARMGVHKIVVLNLFYLPVILAGYYLGRHGAGVLALFCVLCVIIAASIDNSGMAAYTTPLMVGLVLTVWAAVLGLTALLVGTLCDQRAAALGELHEAYVGVVEVVSKYLQGADSSTKRRSSRIAALSQRVAEEMDLPPKQIDDIRVGVLLHDLGNVEVTTKLLGRAVHALEVLPGQPGDKYTFLGTDLVHSLGTVLTDAAPLIVNQDDALQDCVSGVSLPHTRTLPLGSRIIRVARAYDGLTAGDSGESHNSPLVAIKRLRQDTSAQYDPEVLDIIERLVSRTAEDAPVAVPCQSL